MGLAPTLSARHLQGLGCGICLAFGITRHLGAGGPNGFRRSRRRRRVGTLVTRGKRGGQDFGTQGPKENG